MHVTRSSNFSFTLPDGTPVTTHWLSTVAPDGSPVDLPLEQLLDLPTCYPVDAELDGLSGDYHSFVLAQHSGWQSARDYAMRHSEAAPDPEETERRRRRVLARIARLAASE
jgi:hypothetical protein